MTLRSITIVFLTLSTLIYATDLNSIVETITTPPTQSVKKKATKTYTIGKITVVGNKKIASPSILDNLLSQKGSTFSPYKLNRDVKSIQSMGVFSSVKPVTKTRGKQKFITIYVKEKPVIKKIKFTGNTLVSDDELKELIESKEGQVFNTKLVSKDVKNIEEYYTEKGYFLIKVKQIASPSKKTPYYSFDISEGYLDEIIVTGNIKTRDYVILREIELKKGDILNEKILEYDVRKIFNLNYFSKVDPLFSKGSSPNAYKLTLEIEERRTGSLNVGAGYGQRSGGFLYSDIYFDNLRGTGQLIAVKGQIGKKITSYQIKYFNPWMWDSRRSLLLKLWDTQGGFGFNPSDNSYTSEERRGAYVEFGIPFSYEFRLFHGFKLERVTQPSLNNTFHINSYKFGLSYDSRDFRYNPRDGYYNYYSVERGVLATKHAINFTKHDLTLSKFTPTFKKQTIATRFMFGRMYGDTEPSEIYYVGGPNTVRGYEEFPDSFGSGRSKSILNIEYRFLFNDTFQALLFIDAGWATSLGDWRNGKIGKGLGVRIQSPLGPIRLDLGIDEKGDSRIHFNIGHVF